jgi:rhodanese-related sulfurtransferase
MIDPMVQPVSALTVHQLQQQLSCQNGALLLDVRSPAEFAAAHIPGSMLKPVHELDAAAFIAQFGREDKWVYLLCQTGQRARRVWRQFQEAGFRRCVVVEGGLDAWTAAGLPVVRGPAGTLPLMRQVQIVVGLVTAVGSALALRVDPWFGLIPMLMGCGLVFAGVTGFCGLALLLARMPWNQTASCGTASCCGTENR